MEIPPEDLYASPNRELPLNRISLEATLLTHLFGRVLYLSPFEWIQQQNYHEMGVVMPARLVNLIKIRLKRLLHLREVTRANVKNLPVFAHRNRQPCLEASAQISMYLNLFSKSKEELYNIKER